MIDTNVLISRFLVPGSIPAQAVPKAIDEGQLLVSDATLMELAQVLARPKFDPFVTISDRQEFLRQLGRVAERVPSTWTVHACRDPKDNQILEVAVNGNADVIVTGDADLLALGTFQKVAIVTAATYVKGWEPR